jgi:chaperonin GroEL
MQEETASIVEQLKAQARPVDSEKIQDIATISTNGNKELGKLIADAIEKVGEHGIVKSGKSYTSKHEVEHSSGYSIAKGIRYAEFFTEIDALNYEDCNIVVTDQNINWATDLKALADLVVKQPTVIFAPYVGEEALGSLRASCAKSGFHIAVIEPESIGEAQKFELQDIASLTGATFLERDSGVNFKDIKQEHIGKAERVHSIYSKQSTIIYQHKRPKGFYERTKALQSMLSEENQSLKERAGISLAKLTGGVAVIKIAATTDTEQKEILDRVDDAILACRSAQEMGIVAGGGVALAQCGVLSDMFMKIIYAPIRKILSNAGIEYNQSFVIGYNISTGAEIKSMANIGVIDPVKVIITALQNAVSIAGVLLNCTCLICEEDSV